MHPTELCLQPFLHTQIHSSVSILQQTFPLFLSVPCLSLLFCWFLSPGNLLFLVLFFFSPHLPVFLPLPAMCSHLLLSIPHCSPLCSPFLVALCRCQIRPNNIARKEGLNSLWFTSRYQTFLHALCRPLIRRWEHYTLTQ